MKIKMYYIEDEICMEYGCGFGGVMTEKMVAKLKERFFEIKKEQEKKSIEELEKDWQEFKSENIEEYQLEI